MILRGKCDLTFPRYIYVCSPYSLGDTDYNVECAKLFAKYVYDHGFIPLVPHLYFPLFLDDNHPADREVGIFCGLIWMEVCSSLWVFNYRTQSEGMAKEIRVWQEEYPDRPLNYVNMSQFWEWVAGMGYEIPSESE